MTWPSPLTPSRRRYAALLYTTAVLLVVVGAAIAYYTVPVVRTDLSATAQRGLHGALIGGWFAMLGGVAISYKGIVDHHTDAEWQKGWIAWYLIRPFSSFVVGVITFEALQVANTNAAPSLPALAVAAFVFGTQERRFFAFLYQVAQLILSTPADQQAGLQVTSISPDTGKEGTLLLVQGSGFQSTTTATVGGTPLNDIAVSPDGTTLAGLVPPLAPGDAEVVLTNADNTARKAPKQFRYQSPPSQPAAGSA